MSTKNEQVDEFDLKNVISPGEPSTDDPLFDTTDDDFGGEISAATTSTEEPTPDETPDPKPEPEARSPESDDDGDKPTEDAEPADEQLVAREPEREPRIPKSRFDQVNERRKAAERQLEELRRQQAAQDPAQAINFDFEAKEKDYMDAVLDGETAKALAIRNEIRAAEQTVMEYKLRQTQIAAQEQTKTELELKSAIGSLQQQYPIFDGNHERFDQDLTNEALELFEGFKTQGYDPVSAIQRAVRYVVKANDLDASPVEGPSPKPVAAKPAAPKPTREQVQKKLAVASAQPPMPAGQMADDIPDIFAMPEDQFDRLSPQDERVLRGDFV